MLPPRDDDETFISAGLWRSYVRTFGLGLSSVRRMRDGGRKQMTIFLSISFLRSGKSRGPRGVRTSNRTVFVSLASSCREHVAALPSGIYTFLGAGSEASSMCVQDRKKIQLTDVDS